MSRKRKTEPTICKVTDCGFTARKLDMCDAHWMQQRLGVELRPVRRTRKVLEALANKNTCGSDCACGKA